MKLFREPPCPRPQMYLLPPSVDQFVAPDAPVRVLDEVIDQLDCSPFYAMYQGGGAPAYDPKTMFKVLVFGLWQGIRSSRKLEQALESDLRFMYLAQMSRPDFRTIARFRRQNVEAVKSLFAETVRLAQRMGLVLLEHAAVDGTKLEANVSGKRTYKTDRLNKTLDAVEEKIAALLQEAEETDALEDEVHGQERGDEVPKALRDLQRRKELLTLAKEELENSGRQSVAATDLQSRLMKTNAGNRPAYNAQAAVDAAEQIVVAADVTQEETDSAQLPSVVQSIQQNTGSTPERTTADSGYWSETSLAFAEERGLDAYVAYPGEYSDRKTGYTYQQEQDQFVGPAGEILPFYRERVRREVTYRVYRLGRKELWVRQDGERAARMRAKLITPQGRATYRLRQQIVEPVFGHLKGSFGLRRLLLRGLSGARIEFLLACAAHNLGKIARCQAAQPRLMPAAAAA